MNYAKGDKIKLKDGRVESGTALIVSEWESFSEALVSDPKGLGPLDKHLPESINRNQRFFSVLFENGGMLLVGEEQMPQLGTKVEEA